MTLTNHSIQALTRNSQVSGVTLPLTLQSRREMASHNSKFKLATVSGPASRTFTLMYVILLCTFFFVPPKEFPNHTTIDPHRPKASYNLNGAGFHNCAGVEHVVKTIAEIVRIVFKLQNVRRRRAMLGDCPGSRKL